MSGNKAMAAAWATITHALLHEAQSVDDLIEMTGLHRNTIANMLHAARRPEVRCVYIERWEQDVLERWSIACYRLGTKRDAVRPKPKTRAQILRESRARARARALHLQAPLVTSTQLDSPAGDTSTAPVTCG